MTDVSPLFQPLSVKGVTLANRIVMSPMTRRRSPDGVPPPDAAAYYARRASGGAGLIVTEGVGVDHASAIDHPGIPVLHGEAALGGWRAVVDAVHAAGGTIFPQLWHMGPMLKHGTGPVPDARSMRPSGLWGPKGGHEIWGLDPEQVERFRQPVAEMTAAEIEDVVAAYARSARAAKAVGFDGIAIHGAHGYLPDAFLWQETNRRTDAYGGAAGRTRFVADMVRAIRAEVGDAMPIMYRFSQWKQQDYAARLAETPAEMERVLAPLSEAGVDIFDASTRRFWEPAFAGSDLNLAGWAQTITGKPAMTVGSVGLAAELFEGRRQGGFVPLASLDRLMERFDRGEFALVGVGRLHLANPDFADRLVKGQPLLPYDESCLETLA